MIFRGSEQRPVAGAATPESPAAASRMHVRALLATVVLAAIMAQTAAAMLAPASTRDKAHRARLVEPWQTRLPVVQGQTPQRDKAPAVRTWDTPFYPAPPRGLREC
jgi:hypothetical protein